MGMRQPEQRILSHYHYFMLNEPGGANTRLKPFIAQTSNCVTKQLTRNSEWNVCSTSPQMPTEQEFKKAKHRLRTGFEFIGMTEQWDLSICLFNKMFKLTCLPKQFENSRPTKDVVKTNHLYDIVPLEGYREIYDDQLYMIGKDIFDAA